MKYLRVISASLFALTLICIASFFLQQRKLIQISRSLSIIKSSILRSQRPDSQSHTEYNTYVNEENGQHNTATVNMKSLFSSYHLDELELLRPLPNARPLFKYRICPNVRQQLPAYLKGQDIKWSMITFIKSSYQRFMQRQAIRESWGGIRYLNGVRIHVIFVLALPQTPEEQIVVKNESVKFEDILQVELNETYRGIGFKALSAMQWVGDNFPDDWIYFSGDDDILPNLARLLSNIQSMIDEAKEIGRLEDSLPIHCALRQAPLPPVHRKGKWIVSKREYPYDTYPPICLGGFYGMSVKLTKAIYNSSRHYPYFRHDDVFITGFMRVVTCDLSGDTFKFNQTDGFCALSKVQNSNFQHIHVNPELYKQRWLRTEDKMKANGAEILRTYDIANKLPSDLQPGIDLQTRHVKAVTIVP